MAGKIKGRRWVSSTQTSVAFLDMQRKYNYYFLGAARLKPKEQYDAALIYINIVWQFNGCPSALYEISQFYLLF